MVQKTTAEINEYVKCKWALLDKFNQSLIFDITIEA